MSATLSSLAAIVYASLILGIVGFQVALALGAPWGELTMGGSMPGRLSTSRRILAIVQALLLVVLALAVLSRAEVWHVMEPGLAGVLAWVAVGISLLTAILNGITPSVKERRLWFPVGIVLLICSLVVAPG